MDGVQELQIVSRMQAFNLCTSHILWSIRHQQEHRHILCCLSSHSGFATPSCFIAYSHHCQVIKEMTMRLCVSVLLLCSLI